MILEGSVVLRTHMIPYRVDSIWIPVLELGGQDSEKFLD